MSDDQQKGQDVSQTVESEDKNASVVDKGANLSRRKFTKAGIVAAPVVMSLNSRPVMGVWCTPSGMLSGNLSQNHQHQESTSCGGYSPGGWKADNGGQPYLAGTGLREARFAGVFAGVWRDKNDNPWHPDTTLDHVLGNPGDPKYSQRPFTDSGYKELGEVNDGGEVHIGGEVHTGGGDKFNLGFHAVAAYLNAVHRDQIGYAMTVDDVLEMVNAIIDYGVYEPAPGIVWGPQDVVDFIKSTYH